MAEPADDDERDKAVRRYGRLEDQFAALGGYAAESDAARICTNLGLPDRVLAQPLRTLSGGQRRRVELARILFSDAETLLLDEPTNHLDADSIVWLRGLPDQPPRRADRDQPRRRAARGRRQQGVAPRRQPGRASTSTTSAGSPTCSSGRPTSAAASRSGPTPSARSTRSRRRPTRCAPRPPRPRPRKSMDKRAERLASRAGRGPRARQGRQAALPDAGAVRPDAADRRGAVEELRLAGDLHRRRPGHRPGHAGSSSSGSTAPARRRCCGCSPAPRPPTPAR